MKTLNYVLPVLLTAVLLSGCMRTDKPMASRIVDGIAFGKSIEKDGKPGLDSKQTRFSRAQHDNYCWFAVLKDSQGGRQLMVTETFQLPDKGVFNGSTEQKVESSDDGTTWTVKGLQTVDKDKPVIGGCWVVTDDDPLGDYRLSVDIDGAFQHVFTFSIEQ